MYDFSKEISAFQHHEVLLSQGNLQEIRERRNINRNRILSGLSYHGYPLPYAFNAQGSYAMNTMVFDDQWDYDIDDGVYFDAMQLIGPRGGEMSSLEAKRMVCFAIHRNNFTKPPECLKNCVRVYYREGYRIDVPVYRRVVTTDYSGKESEHFELASTNWKRSDARDVTKWFEAQNALKSPREQKGRQMRRICRLVKKFARSRSSWKKQTVSGFVIINLVAEYYQPYPSRDDFAFYQTIANIHNRLLSDQTIIHPVTPNEIITKDHYDSKIIFFGKKNYDALVRLNELFSPYCTEERTKKIWNAVFNSQYFNNQF